MINYSLIPLTSNKFAKVDSKYFDWLNQWKWYYMKPSRGKSGYAVRSVLNKTIRMHRLILNIPKGFQTDHINMDKLDNREANLRIATPQQNSYNKGKYKNNKSGHRGIYFSSRLNKWVTQLRINGERVYCAYFSSKEEAIKNYVSVAKQYFKEFAPQEYI